MNNHLIANELLRAARSMDRSSNLYRIRSYRHAAMVLHGMDQQILEILRHKGRAGLASIPGIGQHIAFTIEMLVRTGKLIHWSDRFSSSSKVENSV